MTPSSLTYAPATSPDRWMTLLDGSAVGAPHLSPMGAVAYTMAEPGRATHVRVEWVGSGPHPPLSAVLRSGVPGSLPRWSPGGHTLAIAVGGDAETGAAVRIESLGDDVAPMVLPVGPEGRIDELLWAVDGTHVTALVAPRDADTAVGAGAVRGDAGSGPRVRTADTGYRRLVELALDGGARTLDGVGLAVWEATPVPGGGYVVVASERAAETDWYRARVAFVDTHGDVRDLHRSVRQVARPAVSPDGARVVVTEGWSSDRGFLAGDACVIDIADGTSSTFTVPGVDVVEFVWRDSETLSFWGWAGTTTSAGTCDPFGAALTTHVDAEVMRDRRWVDIAGSEFTAAVRVRAGGQTQIVVHASDHSEPFATPVGAPVEPTPSCEELTWTADDGLEIHGLLVGADPVTTRPLIVMVHGGPANLWTRAVPAGAMALADAGYAVLLPNPRGSIGRGQAFARSNLGDPAGAELRDVMSGAEKCRTDGLVADRSPGIVGGSYGGYLASCAAIFGHDVAAAVVMFGHPDLLSARFASNNPAFYDILLGGRPDHAHLSAYIERSPVFHAHAGVAPTLILHGDADACTPVGQGEELLTALQDHDVPVELVVYPGEGHGLRSPSVQRDSWKRTREWFARHLPVTQS